MFTEYALEQLVRKFFYCKNIFGGEAHFWMNGYVNKLNCRIWNNIHPQEIQEHSLNTEKDTVWWGFYIDGVIHISLRTTLARLLLSTASIIGWWLTTYLNLNWMIWISACDFNIMALCFAQLMPDWKIWTSNLRTWWWTGYWFYSIWLFVVVYSEIAEL